MDNWNIRKEWRFQSTLPRGERLKTLTAFFIYKDFNPRSREGSDDMHGICKRGIGHFNPRSREGSDDKGQNSCH